MKFPWESFLFKLRKDGADLAGLHNADLLRAFYRYLADESFFANLEEVEQLKEGLKIAKETMERGKSMHHELYRALKRNRRLVRDALELLEFLDQEEAVWWSPNPDISATHGICVSQSTIDGVRKVQKILNSASNYENGRKYEKPREA